MTKSNYLQAYSDDKRVILRDIGPWDMYRTITNDAENVVKQEHENGLGDKLLYYYDSDGALTELVHDGAGKFKRFRYVST